MLNETDLIGNEITHLAPRRAKWKDIAEAILGAVILAAALYGLILFAASSIPQH